MFMLLIVSYKKLESTEQFLAPLHGGFSDATPTRRTML